MESAKWRSVTIAFPRLAGWDDAELERRYIGRDGRWSSTTRAILKALKCDRLDLNLGWASVSQSWACPACGRDKRRIARVTAAGVVLARLEGHHDHLGDEVNSSLRARVGSNWVEQLGPGSGKLANYAEKLVRRFEPSLICHDCNLADGAAKIALKDLPRAFSFSPAEINRFINAAVNREHRIDLDRARELWEAARPQFEHRLALATQLVKDIASGALDQEQGTGSSGAAEAVSLFGHLRQCLSATGYGLIGELIDDLESFERRSIARDGAASNKPRARIPLTQQPSEADVAAHDGNGSPELWHSVSGDWRCPGCDRTRLGLLRESRNKARKWSARLHKHVDYVLIETAGAPFVDMHRNLLICGDCASVLTGVKQRASALSHDRAFLQIADLRGLAEPEDNQPHIVDWEAAATRVRKNVEWRHAVDSYRRHHSEAQTCRSLLAAAQRECGADDAIAWIYSQYSRDHPSWGEDEIASYVEVLLEDAERLPRFLG